MHEVKNAYSNDFKPTLLEVNCNYNWFSPYENLWLTTKWQNAGKDCANNRYRCHVELKLGYQRVLEKRNTNYSFCLENVPGFSQMEYADTIQMSNIWQLGTDWSGTYGIYISIIDDDYNKMPFYGKDNKLTYRQHVGDIEISWSWGRAIIELTRLPANFIINEGIVKTVSKKTSFKNITLNDGGDLTVLIDKNKPQITEYKSKTKSYLQSNYTLQTKLRNYKKNTLYYSYSNEISTDYILNNFDEKSVEYGVTISYKTKKAVEFNLKYYLSHNTLTINMENVREFNNFEFLTLTIPSLLSMKDETAKFVDIWGGGRLINIQGSLPITYVRKYDIRNALGIINNTDMFVYEGTSLDDRMIISIEGTGADKRGITGAVITNRVRAHAHLRSIQAPQSGITLDLLSEEWGEPSWLSVCKFLRRTLKSHNKEIHNKSLHMNCYCTQGPAPYPEFEQLKPLYEITRLNDGYKFNQLSDVVRKIHNITDGYKAKMFVYGYYRQNDENYFGDFNPYVADEARTGKQEILIDAIKEAKSKYNTTLTLYECYDDIYENNGVIEDKYAAMDMYGNPYKGWIWADGLSKIVGFKKYYESGEMEKRIKKMVDIYTARATTYVDVISSETLRYDFDPECPASAHTSHIYRRKIMELYNKYGVDVYSETLIDPYVGYMGYGHNIRTFPDDSHLFSASKAIPVLTALYHGVIGYNSCGFETPHSRMINTLKFAGTVSIEFTSTREEPWAEHAYLYSLPMNQIEDEFMTGYTENGDNVTLEFTNDSKIEYNIPEQKYRIVYKGVDVARDFTSFFPGAKEDTMLAYSLNGGEMTYELPENLANKPLKATILTAEGPGEEYPIAVKGNTITVNMPAKTPLKISM